MFPAASRPAGTAVATIPKPASFTARATSCIEEESAVTCRRSPFAFSRVITGGSAGQPVETAETMVWFLATLSTTMSAESAAAPVRVATVTVGGRRRGREAGQPVARRGLLCSRGEVLHRGVQRPELGDDAVLVVHLRLEQRTGDGRDIHQRLDDLGGLQAGDESVEREGHDRLSVSGADRVRAPVGARTLWRGSAQELEHALVGLVRWASIAVPAWDRMFFDVNLTISDAMSVSRIRLSAAARFSADTLRLLMVDSKRFCSAP